MAIQWSKLKKNVESFFAPSVAGRVALHSTWYRSTGIFAGRAWIAVDGVEVGDFSNARWERKNSELATTLCEFNQVTDLRDPAVVAESVKAYEAAADTLHRSGVLSRNDFYEALYQYPNLSVEEALSSGLPIFRAFAVLDRRLGKRRLQTLELLIEEHPVVRRLFELRCQCEKVLRPAVQRRAMPAARSRRSPTADRSS